MHILLINQYAPPDASPTSRLLGELGDSLRAAGHEVTVVADSSEYRGHHSKAGSRARRELQALLRIFAAMLRAPRADVFVAFSSPPCLLAVAAAAAVIRRRPLVHWAMDLYPDIAVSLGEVHEGLLTRQLFAAMRWAYRRCRLVVALDDDMAAHLKRQYGVAAEVLAPWPAAALVAAHSTGVDNERSSPGAQLAAAQWTWLYSGNLGRAHEWRVLLQVQAELERRELPIQLLFEGGGAMWPDATAEGARLGLRRCKWTGYVNEEQSFETLKASRAIVATQRPEAQGLLWPSKLARIIPMTKPLLWIGPPNGAVARSLESRPMTACFAADEVLAIAGWLESLFKRGAGIEDAESTAAVQARWRAVVGDGCERWIIWLAQIAGHRGVG